MSAIKKDRTHFHTFDALRFLSFFLVFLHHIPIPEGHFLHVFSKAGGIGVSFFFVLSGFLITYILIHDKLSNDGKIPLKNFFVRRILRIWPLYYAMVGFAILTPFLLSITGLQNSGNGYRPNWFFTFAFLENYRMMMLQDFPDTSPLRVMWSLCIEEHFYILWGILLYFVPVRNLPKVILISICTAIIARTVYQHLNIWNLDIFTNLDYFAYGAIPAYIYVFRKKTINRLDVMPASIKYSWFALTFCCVFVVSNVTTLQNPVLTPVLFGILFSVMILLTLSKRNALRIPERFFISKLGKYTYGLYLFHTIFIMFFVRVNDNFGFHWSFVSLLSLATTILAAAASYHFFEKPFLQLKKRFT